MDRFSENITYKLTSRIADIKREESGKPYYMYQELL